MYLNKNENIKNNHEYLVLSDIFKNLSENDVYKILESSVIKKYYKNDLILNKENSSDMLHILLDGIVQIGYLSPSGRFHAFYYYSEKHMLNLLPCLNSEALDYDYYAFNAVKVLQIPKAVFMEEIRNNNALKQDALEILSLRMQHLMHQVKFLQVANLHQKVCKMLLDLARQYGVQHPLGTEIRLKISQHDLADLLSSSRQTIHKEIKMLSHQDILCWQYENIIIKNNFYLKEQVNLI